MGAQNVIFDQSPKMENFTTNLVILDKVLRQNKIFLTD